MFGRRFHNLFRNVIENGDGRDPEVLAKERPVFEHFSSGMYLSGCLAYLEGVYGKAPWNQRLSGKDFDTFLANHPEPHQRENFRKAGISKAGLNALVCIRNAYIHNASDLSKNKDKNSLQKVTSVALPGVSIRDNSFKSRVLTSYANRCAFCGVQLKLIGGNNSGINYKATRTSTTTINHNFCNGFCPTIENK